MGCFKSLVRKIIFFALLIAFFAFGGYAFVKAKINEYQNPPKAEFVKTERNYADFSYVPSDFQLIRNFNVFGYKKVSAKYLPTSQKITIFDLRDEKLVSPSDFNQNKIDKKIDDVLNKLKDSIITLEEFKILQRGTYASKNKNIPYIIFSAKVKNVPFKTIKGTLAIYSTKNEKAKEPSSKIILSVVDNKAYNPVIVKNFISALKF